MRFDADIVVGKLLNIQDAVSSVRRVGAQRDTYADVDVDDLQVLHLQRAIQAAIDVAQHLIAANAWEAPDSSAAYDMDAVSMQRATYPLGTSATWSTYTFGYGSLVSPAVTSNHLGSGGKFLAAWPLPINAVGSSCPGFRFLISAQAFSSGTLTYTKTDMCSRLAPAIEWVSGSGRDYFVIAWLDWDYAVEQNTGEILFRTSSDGISWSTVKSTGIYSIDTPGLACLSNGNCQLSFVRADSETSTLVNQAITMTTSGTMTLGSSAAYSSRLEREPDIAANNNEFLGVESLTTNTTWLMRGWGTFYSTYDTSTTPTNTTYSSAPLSESAEHPGKFAGNSTYNEAYLFYVD